MNKKEINTALCKLLGYEIIESVYQVSVDKIYVRDERRRCVWFDIFDEDTFLLESLISCVKIRNHNFLVSESTLTEDIRNFIIETIKKVK